MKSVTRQTRSHLMSLFEQHGMHPRGDLGQNFLIDLNQIDFIIRHAELTSDDVVLEVGAGTGGLTAFLAATAGAVVSVEYDVRLIPLIQQTLGDAPHVTLLQTDALKNKNNLADVVLQTVRQRLAERPGSRLKLVANLPYNVGTPVISNLVASDIEWSRMVVTIQWELGERLVANPGTSDYSALSVWLQSQCKLELVKKLGPDAFWPRPKVDSAILKIEPWPEGRAAIGDRVFLQAFLRDIFTQRRKHLRGTIAKWSLLPLTREQLDAVWAAEGLSPTCRAEELTPAQLVSLANALGCYNSGSGSSKTDDV